MGQQPGTQGATPRTAYVLSLIGSIFMVISSVIELLFAVFARILLPHYYVLHRLNYYPMLSVIPLLPMILMIISIIGLIISILAIYFSIILGRLSEANAVHSTGIILLVLAIIGFFVSDRFFLGLLGFILLLIGSILAITWKP
ncbi:hypothetical protein [Vulcanisaeta sp. JCM 16159]|uniref:hypothetical protein n=1 Tax=Vulcanisaeta sp. JCM 16159 TaxID=1295371 RepID=UPI0006CF9DA0|nr:hypothetical protein [Vulcanisaeta sp. JCM 16159]